MWRVGCLPQILTGIWLATLLPLGALAQEICRAMLDSPIFTRTNVERTEASRNSFKLLQCSAQWRSAADAQAAGISAEIPIYNIPIPFTANWNQNQVEQWKQQNCSNEERSASYGLKLTESAYSINPVTADKFESCIKSFVDQQAVRCGITETPNSVVFEAVWRRTTGESPSAAPKVRAFSSIGAQCVNGNQLSPNTPLNEGGISILCSVGEQVPVFTLNTDRGQCFAAASANRETITLQGTIVLQKSETFRGRTVQITADAKVVTNGFPLRINADILRIDGSPQIISFVTRQMAPSEDGRDAAPIDINAKRVIGAGLSILNVGENGGNGTSGAAGGQGAGGSPGVGRSPLQVGGDIGGFIRRHVPLSCTGGRSGGNGGQGLPGENGTRGGHAGDAGEVRLGIPDAASPQSPITVLVNTGIDGRPRDCGGLICGGTPGQGGRGGAGGPGGPGGSGGPAEGGCGGTSGGSTGPQGAGGANGPDGQPGNSARRVLL